MIEMNESKVKGLKWNLKKVRKLVLHFNLCVIIKKLYKDSKEAIVIVFWEGFKALLKVVFFQGRS